MRWTDEGLGDAIRQLDPAAETKSSAASEAHAKRRFEERVATVSIAVNPGRRPTVRMRRPWTALLAPLAAIAAVVIVAVAVVPPGEPASALTTPPPLEFHDNGASLGEVVAAAQSALISHSGPAMPLREVTSTGWYYQVDDLDTDTPRTVISPEVTSLRWEADLSGSIRTVAGRPYWSDLYDSAIPTTVRSAGTLIWEMDFAPGEFQSAVTDTPGETADDVRTLLEGYGLTDRRSAFDVLNTIDTITQYWTLTDQQFAELLTVLGDTDARVLGSAIDRDGRPVVGIAALLPSAAAELHVLISAHTGRVVGFETFTLRTDQAFPADAVISYRIWDTQETWNSAQPSPLPH